MTSERLSLQDRIRRRQHSEFVGRDDQLALFRRNFGAPLDERIYIFNVFGQGGVGKTTLLRRYRELARASGALTALTDQGQTDVLTAMDQLASDLADQGHELRAFAERYRTYRQRRQELEEETHVDAVFDWLRRMPFVEERPDGWAYHAVVREQMLRYKRRESQQNWTTVHARLAGYYQERAAQLNLEGKERWNNTSWLVASCETLYHRVCSSFQQYLGIAINEFLATRDGGRAVASDWANVIQQAEEDLAVPEQHRWGERMHSAIAGYEAKRFDDIIALLTDMLARTDIEPHLHATALDWRGSAYRLSERYEAALADLNAAHALQPTNTSVLIERGSVYEAQKQYDQALAEINRAIELDPHYATAFAIRGSIYRALRRNDEAVTDLNRAIELRPQFAWAFGQRGGTYREIQRYEEALIDFSRAVELDSHNLGALAQRGATYRQLQRYDESLDDLSRAIELDPQYAWALAQRGETYRTLQCYDEALADLSRAIELDPQYAWALRERTELYRQLQRHPEALADLSRAIDLDPASDWKKYQRALVYLLAGDQSAAAADFARAIELARQKYEQESDDWTNAFNLALYLLASSEIDLSRQRYRDLAPAASVPALHHAIEDLDDYLDSFPDNDYARAIRADLQAEIERRQADPPSAQS